MIDLVIWLMKPCCECMVAATAGVEYLHTANGQQRWAIVMMNSAEVQGFLCRLRMGNVVDSCVIFSMFEEMHPHNF